MITGIIIFLVGVWVGLYATNTYLRIRGITKAKAQALAGLRSVRKDNWKHCRDEIDAAITFIEKYNE